MRKRVSTPFSRAYNSSTFRGVQRRLKNLPKKAAYSRNYSRTKVALGKGCLFILFAWATAIGGAALLIAFAVKRASLI
jgi:hypothetical protein